jgi:hypothetical protein
MPNLSSEFISLQLEGLNLRRISAQWKDAAMYTDQAVTLLHARNVSTLTYFQMARTVDALPATDTSSWRVYQDDPGTAYGSGSCSVV